MCCTNHCCICSGRNCMDLWRTWLRPFVMLCYAVILVVVLPVLIIRLQQSGAHPHDQAWFIGGLFVLLALPITIWEITQHLVHYTKPHLQKHVIRILWMVPIYALNAWLGLMFPEIALYLDTCRECYEAYVIYNFMIFLLNFLYEERNLGDVLERKPPVGHFFPLCCLPKWKMGRSLIERCKHGILQYTVIRPITTTIALICELAGVYGEGHLKPNVAFPYLLAINNFSQFVAMYSLIFFYKAHREELAEMKPLSKFLCIKAVVFFSFFQGVLIGILVNTGVISESFTTKDDKVINAVASSLQDFLICIEMFLAALAHLYAFSYKPYVDPENDPAPCWDSFKSMWDVSDVRRDVSDHFRAVGSTVQRSVARRKVPNTSHDDADERTRLLQPKQVSASYQDQVSPVISPTLSQPSTSTTTETSSIMEKKQRAGTEGKQHDNGETTGQEDDEFRTVSIDGPMEKSLIDFSSDVNT